MCLERSECNSELTAVYKMVINVHCVDRPTDKRAVLIYSVLVCSASCGKNGAGRLLQVNNVRGRVLTVVGSRRVGGR